MLSARRIRRGATRGWLWVGAKLHAEPRGGGTGEARRLEIGEQDDRALVDRVVDRALQRELRERESREQVSERVVDRAVGGRRSGAAQIETEVGLLLRGDRH